MEATFAEEYSAIHKGLLHYLGLSLSQEKFARSPLPRVEEDWSY